VLAHLVLGANQVVPAEHLVDAVWGDDLPQDPKATLQIYVSRLRSAIGGDAIEGRPPGYLLHADPDEVDALRFESLLREVHANTIEPGAAATTLGEALELWRGPALADLASEPSLSGEIARLEELRLQATEEKIAAELDLGREARVVAELETLTRTHPLRERLWGELMLALYRLDRQAEALSAFERARALLAEELGIDPSRDLQVLHERILRQDPDLVLKGEPLRGYRILEEIGEGAFGVVYRATQPQIGREVAIKAVHPELANHPDFVRRFEREAQIVARLEHPHIVPLYDYWREPDAAYLVMRFLRGGSLEELLAKGPLEPAHAATILDQVAAALAAAHRQGVVHRDVKPGNVLLDEEGNAYLTDFAVALDAGAPEKSSGTMIRGTPAYLSPEQIRLEPASPATDVYALGIVLYEMLTGAHPFSDASLTALVDRHGHDALPSVRAARPELPPAVDRTIARATAKDAKASFADPVDLAVAFRAAIEGSREIRASIGEIRNPYKGLRPFLEADAADFFGRESVTAKLVRRLEETDEAARFLAVVGPSGSGKSSVVRAGLIPALRRGALPGSDRWFLIDMQPGAHPLRELGSALLGVAVEPPPSLLDELERDELGLLRAAERVLPDADADLLIVLDQLEEVFTMVRDEDERSRFLGSVRAAAMEPGSRVRFVVTLRADFFDEPLSIRGFGELLAARTEAITPMSPEELERAIVAPAARAGLVVEPRLLAALLTEVVDQPGALPLLQYALTELAERATAGALTLDAYRRIGGASGALARRAEHLYEALDDGEREACRQLFLRLVTLGESTEDTRRRIGRSELAPLVDQAALERVTDPFGRYRLLSFDRDPSTREPTIEIAHEALLDAWARLRAWIDEARDDIRALRRLDAAAAEWEAGGRDQSFLLRGARLEQTHAWVVTTTLAPSRVDRSYIDASLRQRDDEQTAERRARERERALERRSIRRLRSLVGLGVAAALIATTLTVIAVDQRGRARDEARISAARELAAASVANLEADPELSILLATQAIERTRSVDGTVLPEAEEALHLAVTASRIANSIPTPGGSNLDWSSAGVFVRTPNILDGGSLWTGPIELRDPTTGAIVRRLPEHDGEVTATAFASDGSMLATTATDGGLKVWDVASGDLVTDVQMADQAWGPSFDQEGSRVAAIWGPIDGPGSTVRVIDLTTHDVRAFPAQPWANDTAFGPDGDRLVVVGGYPPGEVRVIDLETGEVLLRFEGPGDHAFTSVAWSPDGRYVAAGGWDRSVPIWDARTWDLRYTLVGHSDSTYWVEWSPDSSRLVTSSEDGTAKVWAITDHGTSELMTLTTAENAAGVAFSPDGTQVMTGSSAGAVRVWDVGPTGDAEWVTIPDAPGDFGFLPTGPRLLASGSDGSVRSWDLEIGRGDVSVDAFDPAPDTRMMRTDLGPDGASVVTWHGDAREAFFGAGSSITIRDVASGEELFGLGGPVNETAWSLDGAYLATAGAGVVTVYDLAGNAVWALPEHIAEGRLRFGPGGLLATGGRHGSSPDDAIKIWDLRMQALVATIPSPGGSIAFDRSGALLATDGEVLEIWNIERGELVAELPAPRADVNDLAFSPDGTRLAVASADGKVRLFDLGTGEEVLVLPVREGICCALAFNPDGSMLATRDSEGTVRVWALDIDDLLEIARSEVTRSLTDEECHRYLHVERCPAS
jgi:WD40 repeat protein/DNA-binding SARP family transcriptional activator